MNIGIIVSISILIAAIEYFFHVPITPNLSNGYVSLAIYALIFGFFSAFMSLALSRVMAKWTYSITPIVESRLIDEPQNVQLVYTTVAKIARQEGITMPEVGVYESAEPNAFATGPTKNRALVAVSSGLLSSMKQEEIEGVIGHEMAHVLNGDMVTMTLLQGILNVIVIFVSRILASFIASAIQKSDDGDSTWISHGIAIVLEIVLGLVSMIVLMAFSRYREYRADIGSAKYVGKSSMLKALKRLLTLKESFEWRVTTDERVATLQIASYSLSSLFSSHPALEDRIHALEESREVL